MSTTCMVGQYHKICLWMVLNGEKTGLRSMKNSYKNYDEDIGKRYIFDFNPKTAGGGGSISHTHPSAVFRKQYLLKRG